MHVQELGPRTRLLKFIDKLLKVSGQNVFYDNWYSKSLTVVLSITLGIILILGCIEPFTGDNMKMTKIAEIFDMIGPYSQVSA